MTGLIFILSGPSGTGKASVAKGSGLEIAPSWTTREPKPRDQPGEYVHVTKHDFSKGWQSGQLLEYNEHFSNLYGLAKPAAGKVLITDIDVNGALSLKDRPDVILVGILPADPIVETCLNRLRGRGDELEAEIIERKARIEYEAETILSEWPRIIRNHNLADAQRQLRVMISNICRSRGITLP
ncbi:hypothetical protein H0W80_03510 [Candidatus Saccharibacteria bacterium]|nr:hypothetical protein [Candidatus Saccharibacteria bacterium]